MAKGGMAPMAAPAGKNTTVFAAFSHYDGGSDSSLNGADYDLNSNGGIVGARYQWDMLSFGGFVGYDQGDVDSAFLNADVDGWVTGVFVNYLANQEYNINVTGGVTYGSYEYDGVRNSLGGAALFNGVGQDVFDIYTEVRGDVYHNNRLRITPSLGLHYITSDTDSILEVGSGTALAVRGMDEDAFLAELELELEYEVTSSFFVNGSIGYTHNFMDSDRNVSANFVRGGAPFTVVAPGMGDDIFSAGVGAVWFATDALSVGAGYRAEFSSDSDMSNSIGLGASYSF